jgi:hypothetical protein
MRAAEWSSLTMIKTYTEAHSDQLMADEMRVSLLPLASHDTAKAHRRAAPLGSRPVPARWVRGGQKGTNT